MGSAFRRCAGTIAAGSGTRDAGRMVPLLDRDVSRSGQVWLMVTRTHNAVVQQPPP